MRDQYISHRQKRVLHMSLNFQNQGNRLTSDNHIYPTSPLSRARARSAPSNGRSLSISGPRLRPESAKRSGKNRVLPLRSVFCFKAVVHSLHVSAVNSVMTSRLQITVSFRFHFRPMFPGQRRKSSKTGFPLLGQAYMSPTETPTLPKGLPQ